ncbi:Polysaccharide pyruvyl transferase family protein WcaK [Paenibacillus sp. yr247]|uniref:polysaccharide pyruvyl transferase family protein n=1 Tax=Paenibacillus sp. yr247 TaxID=1761880 RepID=UPI00087FCB8F|nr:polysaccharide pyruvyl transferase family protein [Paenibacillus sp. yr247]SDO21829.1 Polysaccharide pyruvyl transferase family protein WcaK [Paenibacillus sp. yr247]
MNIGVSGYYGFGNFGDELFLRTLKQTFAEDCIFPFSSFLDISKVDAVIIGGGDLITPYHYNNFYFPQALSSYPTWVYGVGIVDFYPEETWPEEEVNQYRDRLQITQGLFVRDEWSAEIALKKQFHTTVKVVPDIAFGYKEPNYPIRFSNKPVIGVCTFSYEDFPFENVVKILTELSTRNYHIVLIPVILNSKNPYSDSGICLRLMEQIKAANPGVAITIADCNHDLDMTYSYIQSVDYLITFKLHPAIVALRKGIPVLCLSKLGKVKSMLGSFNLQQYMVDYEEPLQRLMSKVELLLSAGKKDVSTILPLIRLKEKIGDAELNSFKKMIRHQILR